MPQKEKQTKRQAKKGEQNAKRGERGFRTGQIGGKKEAETSLAPREQFSTARMGSPFAFMRQFSEEMDRLFGDLGFRRGLASEFGRLYDLERSIWAPQVELFEREGKLTVRADLPGLTKDDINVDLTDDAIKIRGERRQEKEENEEGYYRSERSYGSFYREIPLPSGVNREEANATFNNGVLEITLPAPARQSGSRRIEIGVGGEPGPQAKAIGKAAGK
jgi:HSP20 family protein